ncbi:amidohydrolase [candidate division WOR-3 bacterium]|nr:amidohydrolase [candidate division WOR-3 bacterium]
MLKINDIYIENGLIVPPSKPDRELIFPDKEIYPGFCDSHTHLVQCGIKKSRLNLSSVKSKGELYELLNEWIKNEKTKDIIIAEDWDESNWKHRGFPTREELTKISKNKAVILRRICGHIAIANEEALSRLPGEWKRIDRTTGILKEDVVLRINEIFPISENEIKEGILLAQKEMIELGVTSVHDIMTPEYFRAYQSLEKEKELKISVYCFITEGYIDSIPNLRSSNKVKLAGTKVFIDGSIGARTAALEDFSYIQGGKGLLLRTKEQIEPLIRLSNENGYQLAFHAIGDRAIQTVLDAMNVNPVDNPGRHRIEHFELARDKQIKQAIKKNLILSMQPNFLKWSKPCGLYENVLKKDYQENNRLSFIMEEGGNVCFGSDGMPYGPLFGIKQAVTAPSLSQRITKSDAIRAYTKGGAYASFKESETGDIQKGMKADLVVVDEKGIYMTIIDGRIIYQRESWCVGV